MPQEKLLVDNIEGSTSIMVAGGKKRVEISEGQVLVNGVVRLADGTELLAILEFDELSGGEHCGTFVWDDSGVLVDLHDKTSSVRKQKTDEQVFPYRYKYNVPLNCHDHHIGADGWSL